MDGTAASATASGSVAPVVKEATQALQSVLLWNGAGAVAAAEAGASAPLVALMASDDSSVQAAAAGAVCNSITSGFADQDTLDIVVAPLLRAGVVPALVELLKRPGSGAKARASAAAALRRQLRGTRARSG